jgi:hypothetical protein
MVTMRSELDATAPDEDRGGGAPRTISDGGTIIGEAN